MFITLKRKTFYKKIKKDKNFENQMKNIYGEIIYDSYFIKEDTLFIFYQKEGIIVASLRINKKVESNTNNKYFQIRNVFVNPDFRGKGYCKKIISHIIEILENEKLDIILDVLPDNIPAISCYKGNNFIEDGKTSINNIEHIRMIYKK